jgi:hypothetical protein
MSLAAIGRYVARHHLGLIALFVALGGTSYALTGSGGGPNQIRACVSKANGSLRVVARRTCKGNERLLVWNRQGPPGIPGAPGAAGAAGPTGPAGPAEGGASLEPWHIVGAAGEPPFTADWTEITVKGHPIGFRKDANGQVFLKGKAKPVSGSWEGNKATFVLPAGYRPPTDIQVAGVGQILSLPGQILIEPDGSVRPLGNAKQSGEASFDGISFFVD